VRPGADDEAIEIFVATAKEKVVKLEAIFPIRSCFEIEQAPVAVALEFLSAASYRINAASIRESISLASHRSKFVALSWR